MIKFFKKRKELLENTDPHRIYVENVRSFFGLNHTLAKLFCEMAVKENYFKKKIAIECPNNACKRVISSHDKIPKDLNTVHCEICELNEEESHSFSIDDVSKTIFYQLNK